MQHANLRRWVAGVSLALGVAFIGACADDHGGVTDPGRPSFGGTPIDPTGDRTVEFELFELCKDYAGQSGPPVTFDVTVDRNNDGTGADVSFQVTLADGECREIWTDGGPTQDLVTVTEQVPVPATGSYEPSFVKTKLVRMNHVDNVVVDPSTAGNSTSEAFSGDTPSGVVGVLLEFTNTYMPPGGVCTNGPVGGIDLGVLPDYLFFFADGNQDANWQGASKGFAGDAVVDGILAKERTSGSVPYAGTIFTNDGTLNAWQKIVDQNSGQAFGSTGNAMLVSDLKNSLLAAFAQIDALPVTTGYASRSASSLDGVDTRNGMSETTVINVTSGFEVSSQINIAGDPGDVFVLRWDTDADPTNGYQGIVKFKSGGAIVPQGGLTAGNFIHVAGDLNASGGGSTPPPPYPQGPRLDDGTGQLIEGGKDFSGGGFFTGYWLTTGSPKDGRTQSFSNAIFVGGWYSLTTKFSMTSGTSGVHVCP